MSLLMCLVFSVCLVLTGCPKPKQTQIIVDCNPQTRQCTIRTIITWLGSPNDLANQAGLSSGVFDLNNAWNTTPNGNPYAVVKITNQNGQITQSTFSTQLSTGSGNINSVDKDTTPHEYVFQNPTAVNNFIGQSLAGENEATIDIEFVESITQVDCEIPSGKYINHVRYADSSGVSYLDEFTFLYSIPENVHGANACEQATITIAE